MEIVECVEHILKCEFIECDGMAGEHKAVVIAGCHKTISMMLQKDSA